MKLIENMTGEYVYITKEMYPPVMIFYKDKKVLKSQEITDIISASSDILHQLCLPNKHMKDLEQFKDDVLEILIDKTGIIAYTLKP